VVTFLSTSALPSDMVDLQVCENYHYHTRERFLEHEGDEDKKEACPACLSKRVKRLADHPQYLVCQDGHYLHPENLLYGFLCTCRRAVSFGDFEYTANYLICKDGHILPVNRLEESQLCLCGEYVSDYVDKDNLVFFCSNKHRIDDYPENCVCPECGAFIERAITERNVHTK